MHRTAARREAHESGVHTGVAHYKGIRFDNYCHVVLISLDVFINCNNYNVLGFTNYIHVG